MSAFVALGDVPEVARFRQALKPITDRSDGEKLALLKLRYGNDQARACEQIARTIGWPEPTKADWRNLFREGLIARAGPRQLLALTSLGLMVQRQLANAMARIGGLHFMVDGGADRFAVHIGCTCGGWTASLSLNEGYLNTGKLRAHSVHIDAVRKGIWRKPRSVEEIVSETMARQAAATMPGQSPAKEAEHVDA